MTIDEYKYTKSPKIQNSIALKSRGLCNNQEIVQVTTSSYDNNLFKYGRAVVLSNYTLDDKGARIN
jgi:hypothetical protein